MYFLTVMCEVTSAYVYFFSTLSNVESIICSLGRECVSCGIMFVCVDEQTGAKHLEIFYSDALRHLFYHDPYFKIKPAAGNVVEGYTIDGDKVQGFLVCRDKETLTKVYNLCRACNSTKKEYNSFDRVCSALVPFYLPKDDQSVFEVNEMHSAQAVVLILRSCLSPDHPMRRVLDGVNSRGVTPDSLKALLQTVGGEHAMCLLH